MKIAIPPFASTFTEFFINVAQYLSAHGHEVYFLQADPYVSTLLKRHKQQIVYYPLKVEQKNVYNAESDIVRYFTKLNRIAKPDKFIKQMNNSYSRAAKFFGTNHFDRVIIWNGEANVESKICEDLGMVVWYCENGYFPNTFQMNTKGVNCKAVYANCSYNQFMQFRFAKTDLAEIKFSVSTIKHSLAKRYFYRFFSSRYRSIMWQALQSGIRKKAAKRQFNEAPTDTIKLETLGKFAFFPLQVNTDTQILLNSNYSSMYEVLECTIPKLIGAGYKVVLKEHPEELEPVNYSAFVDNKNVFLVRKYDLNKLIEQSSFVINVNSSVGLQAVAKHKPVIVLGESFYLSAPSVCFMQKDQALPKISKANIEETEQYIQQLKDELFITGNWRKLTNSFLQQLCSRILA